MDLNGHTHTRRLQVLVQNLLQRQHTVVRVGVPHRKHHYHQALNEAEKK